MAFPSPFCAIALSLSLPVAAQGQGRVLRMSDARTVVELSAPAEGPSYRLSFDGGSSFGDAIRVEPKLMLRYAEFDPLSGEPPFPAGLRAPADSRLFLVQYHTQELEAYRRELRSLGAEIWHHVPWQASLLRIDPDLVARVRALPYVRWVGRLHPAYRLDSRLVDAYLKAAPLARARYDIQLVGGEVDRLACVAAIARLGGKVVSQCEGDITLEAMLDAGQLFRAAALDTIAVLEPSSEPEEDMNNARAFGGANYLESPLRGGHRGVGVRGHIMEGVYATHPEFAASGTWRVKPFALRDGRASGHGNATFGIVFAKGVLTIAKGLLPEGQGMYDNYLYVYSSTTRRYALVGELVNPSLTRKGMFQTASWGYSRTTSYTTRSAEMDNIVFNHDIPITQSQSNAGATSIPRNSRPQAWGKNMISVGGVRHYNTLKSTDDKWARSGSIGPAADGRIKPDLCGYYDFIYTTGYRSTGYTTGFGGTSGATPIVAGHVGLSIELWTDGVFGQTFTRTGWQNRFANRPHFTTTKAMLINTARQYPFTGTGHDLTRTHQGWGWPNVQRMYDERERMLVINETDILVNGAVRTYFVQARSAAEPLRVTMTYSDPAAAAYASITRINDLDLKVTDPNGVVYWGNNGLLAGNWSTSGGVKNNRDTVENVFVQNPVAGVYRIDVIGASIVRDARKETPSLVDADFALVATGLEGMRDAAGMQLALTTSGQGDLKISLTKVPAAGWAEGLVLLSLTTGKTRGHGSLLGVEFDSLTAAGFTTPAQLGNPGHFPRTTNPSVFPNVPFQVPAGALGILKGLSLDGVAVLGSAGKAFRVSNVSRVKM